MKQNCSQVLKFRGPTQIVINLTNKCNMRCDYCFNSSGNQNQDDELSDNKIRKIIKEIINQVVPYNVCFSGGEPLLRWNLLIECIETLTKNNIRTNIVSNGTLLNQERILQLVNSGLQEIQLSLDGANSKTHEQFRTKGSFKKVIEVLDQLRQAKFPSYGVSMVLSPYNWFEIGAIADILMQLDTHVFAIRPMLNFGRAVGKEKLQITPMQRRSITRTIHNYKTYEDKLRIIYPDPMSHMYAFLNGDSYYGMEIKANGDIICSPYIQLPMGNLCKHSITDYWEAGWPSVWKMPVIVNLVDKIKKSAFIELEECIRNIGNIELIDYA